MYQNLLHVRATALKSVGGRGQQLPPSPPPSPPPAPPPSSPMTGTSAWWAVNPSLPAAQNYQCGPGYLDVVNGNIETSGGTAFTFASTNGFFSIPQSSILNLSDGFTALFSFTHTVDTGESQTMLYLERVGFFLVIDLATTGMNAYQYRWELSPTCISLGTIGCHLMAMYMLFA